MSLFLANENIPYPSILLLRKHGLDVVAVIEEMRGSSDTNILTLAAEQNRIIITFVRDYGELGVRQRLPISSGVIYLRFDPVDLEEPARRVIELVEDANVTLDGMFTVVGRTVIRRHSLPASD